MNRTRFQRIVFAHLRRVRLQILAATLCVVGSTVVTLAAPWPLKLVFDHVLLRHPLPASLGFLDGVAAGGGSGLALLAALVVALAVFGASFSYYQLFLTSRIGYQLVYTLRSELFDHLQRLSLSFHTRARSGELLSKITGDTNTLKDVYAESALAFATHLLTIAGMFAVMFALNWRLSLVVLLSFPILFAAMLYLLRNVRAAARQRRKREGRLASRTAEILTAVPLVQAFGREDYERSRFDAESAQSMEESIRAVRIEAAATRVVDLVSAVGTALVILFGGLQALRGALTPGELLVFAAYVNNLYKPVRLVARLSAKFSAAMASTERINEILEIEPEIRDAPDAIEARGLRGGIVFEDVSFGYSAGRPVLHGLSFALKPGERVALVGASGAGKSTIASLILRLYDPGSGRILVDGVDLKGYRRHTLRREIGVVLQDTVLLGTTIRENIAYGKPDAGMEEIEAAAREVHAHDFIAALPEGYETVLGERGVTLSGGQRQRICLARALVKRPSILIMDEPTSAVDPESEALIRDAVGRLQEGKTVLMIAHRFEAVREADRILVLKGGRLVEQGTHEELVRAEGYYRQLFRLQESVVT